MPLPRTILTAWRTLHRSWCSARGQAPITAHLDHPFAGGFFDAGLCLRGWVSSEAPVTSVTITSPQCVETATLDRRLDVEESMSGRYAYHTGFKSTTPAARWIGTDDATPLNLTIETSDGRRHENAFSLAGWRTRKMEKLRRITPLLACPSCQGPLTEDRGAFRCAACAIDYPLTNNSVNFLTRSFETQYAIEATENVSAWDYDPKVMELIAAHPDQIFLDCGAGLRKVLYPNVINFEIVDYSSTDVLGVGERLPFRSGSLGGVISVGVLEHVKDPFLCAREIARVLKPGGVLFCAVPFIQPLHAYPHHYYNMTAQGLANLFPTLDIREQFVPLTLHPLKAVQWVVYQYARGLAQPQRKAFVNMRVQDLIDLPLMPQPHPDMPFVKALHPDKIQELASGNCIVAYKK